MISQFASLLNFRGQEEQRYTVLSSQGPFEIRLYQRYSAAKVIVSGEMNEAFLEGKKQLIDYLSGNNFRVERIPSLPIYYITPSKKNEWEAGVMLECLRITSEIPRPINRLVRLEEFSPIKTAALKCHEINSPEIFYRREEELRKWIDYKSLTAIGAVKMIHFDKAVPMPFTKNKEIIIPVL